VNLEIKSIRIEVRIVKPEEIKNIGRMKEKRKY